MNKELDSNERQIDRMSGGAGFAMLSKWLFRIFFSVVAVYSLTQIIGLFFGERSLQHAANISMMRGMMKDIRIALGQFKTEYNIYPVPPSESHFLRTEGTLLLALMGEDKHTNPRGIKFVDLAFSKDLHGLVDRSGGSDGNRHPEYWEFRDYWGEKFYLLIEADGDNRIPNPEHRTNAVFKSNTREPEFLNASVILFSSGPDRDPNTWDDNICSWR